MSSASASPALHGTDIATFMKSSGPTVKCVLLLHMRRDGKDGKPHLVHSSSTNNTNHNDHPRVVLTELIEEIEVDTTPSKNEIPNILGGPFTFLGQYETEGTVVMARRELPENLDELEIAKLRELCKDHKIDVSKMIEKTDLVDALQATVLPWNPHTLQKPLEHMRVRGDILLLKVAETREDEDDEEPQDLTVISNEEFFLDYTKEEYVAFASRTDVVAPIPPQQNGSEDEKEEGDEGDDDEEDDDDEDYEPGQEGDDPDEKQALLNLLMSDILIKFREENGRGPDTEEVLALRSQVAAKLGIELPAVEESNPKPADRRRAGSDLEAPGSPKRVHFTGGSPDLIGRSEGNGETPDSKVSASNGESK